MKEIRGYQGAIYSCNKLLSYIANIYVTISFVFLLKSISATENNISYKEFTSKHSYDAFGGCLEIEN